MVEEQLARILALAEDSAKHIVEMKEKEIEELKQQNGGLK